ncbi:hypothetical protein L917_17195, partial [Phytophthora nicotianae]
MLLLLRGRMGSLCPANFHMYIPLQVDPLNAKG